MLPFSSVEVCSGAGGQALGLEQAGFDHLACVEIDADAVRTLNLNRPKWKTFEEDLNGWSGRRFRGADLFAAGLPCPPFSKAGKQLGEKDERNLFAAAVARIDEIRPRAVMIENVRGILDAVFDDFRNRFKSQVEKMGYKADWKLLNASDFGVPQLRPRVIFVAIKNSHSKYFDWPKPVVGSAETVGETLKDLMAANGWRGANQWAQMANEIAPTLVGGSKKHGGPDLGPTRAKKAWAQLQVNGHTIAEEAPERNFEGMPRLTVRMCARIQGFPDDWQFYGRKTTAYRQVGNAFPPPVARAVGLQIRKALAKMHHAALVG
jgi:DNA (cytosine-5)-methyltransferase 1